jgi:RNA polymerase I-specific transcription initiation factor RRN3
VIVGQFAKVAHHTDFLYCYPIIEANRRSGFGSVGSAGGGGGGSSSGIISSAPSAARPSTPTGPRDTQVPAANPVVRQTLVEARMDSHFPFDPYKLPLSKSYIDGIYRQWEGIDGEDEDDDEDDDDDDDDDDDEEDEGLERRSGVEVKGARDGDDYGLGESFGGMSISPVPGTRPSMIAI